MKYTCSWCLLAGYTIEQATKEGPPPAYDDITGEPICADCIDELIGAEDVLEEMRA